MGTKRNKYFAKVGGTDYVFSGAEYIYNALKSKLNVKLLTERTVDSTILNRSKPVRTPEEVRKALPKIVLVLATDTIVTNAAQSTKTRTMKVYCDPDSVEKAMLGVLNVSITPPGLAGQIFKIKIVDAYIPRRRVYI
ncbi:MAG: hypothetical protein DCF15_17245 [Phormidesmis priestleyi]|uniref:Uncharacterized protein n=1 Tax=Phormidesmis priestleyi TaxID=268141 RepID=A0A2W4WVZ3_9CYAN|nr:MAG: hypothetical protein DCF15_17245 [Phormidesmis priestleyi]